MRYGLVIVALACLLTACKGRSVADVFDLSDDEAGADSIEAFVGDTLHLFDETEEPPQTVDELFDDFLYAFMDDSRFQKQRIVFPLSCSGDEEGKSLSRQEWESQDRFQKLEFYSFIYEREKDFQLTKDTTAQSVDVEWIDLRHNNMERFRFNRLEGKWMLTSLDRLDNSDTPNGDFLAFYAQFVNDSTFQRKSLANPVKLVLTSDDGEDSQVEELTADDWFAMHEDIPLDKNELVNIDYGQAIISQNRKTLLVQGASNGFMMKFTFDKRGSDWKLIEIDY